MPSSEFLGVSHDYSLFCRRIFVLSRYVYMKDYPQMWALCLLFCQTLEEQLAIVEGVPRQDYLGFGFLKQRLNHRVGVRSRNARNIWTRYNKIWHEELVSLAPSDYGMEQALDLLR